MPLNITLRWPVKVRGRVRCRFREILSNRSVVLYHFRTIGFQSNGFRPIGVNSQNAMPGIGLRGI